ncbi:MAG: hypothetical protein B7Z44_14920 [Caulobacter sp. 12-67-6]|nr:MAG: hypothetical protein B7Z44_14920 [Caulobacter sp. 12-67-6]OYX68309.1 MAG: hypothetical protein B7Y81_17135 [Caulobacter sp. 32-67-35]OYX95110.1 MAG: hypothetical protein B7Y78_05605 [Caulobacter sp. 35-67-4]OZA73779.1 MAG: hypothetical protein B7X77_09360 [Caulobacter sp. 39-67-4]HQR90555.1 Pr6Pr family membrane protein [Caulobacter sp.]
MTAWRILIAVLAWTGVTIQYGLMIHNESWASGPWKTVEFFSYFTILSNLLAGVVLTAPLVAPASRLAAWAEASSTRIAAATYLAITALVYHGLLADIWDPKGLGLVADTLLHTVTPIAVLADWLLRGGKGPARWSGAFKALAFPALFGVWTLLHGALTDFYPYPFLDVTKRGYPGVMVMMLAMSAGFLVVAVAFTVLHRARARLAIDRRAPLSA